MWWKHFRVSRRDDKKIRLTPDTCDSLICISKTFTYIYSQKVLLNKDLCLLAMCACLGGSIMQSIVIPNPRGNVFLTFFPVKRMTRNRWWWISMDGASASKNIQPGVIWICIVELWISLQVQSTSMTCHHLKKLSYSDIPQTHRNLLQVSSLSITGTHQCIPRLVAVSDEPQRTRSNKPCRRDVARCG